MQKKEKESIFPVIYGIISALISFIAVFFICLHSFRMNLQLAIILAGVFAIFFFGLSYFRGHASVESKRIAYIHKLTHTELAIITCMKDRDCPIHHVDLQLLLSKRYWPRVLDTRQNYEKEHDSVAQ